MADLKPKTTQGLGREPAAIVGLVEACLAVVLAAGWLGTDLTAERVAGIMAAAPGRRPRPQPRGRWERPAVAEV